MSDQPRDSLPSTLPRPTVLGPLHLRLFALLFDYALIVASVKLVQQVLLGEHWDLRPVDAATGWQAFATPWQGAMVALLFLRYLPGASVGKWITGVAVRCAADPAQAPDMGARVLRNLSLVLLPIEGWLVFSDRFGRRLGDRLAGTIVVQHPKPADLFQRAMGLGVLFLGLVLAGLLVTSWNLHRSAAFQVALAVAEQDPALKRRVGSPVDVDRSPELELHLPGSAPSLYPIPDIQIASGSGAAVATFDATGPAGKAKLRVQMSLVPATVEEPAHWHVEQTEVLDTLGGPLKQQDAPKQP
jgi:uncharacterized RDD family membrane protein YckC